MYNQKHQSGSIHHLLLPFFLMVILGALSVISYSLYIVDPGFSVVHLRMGKIIATKNQAGYYFRIPVIDSVIHFDLRIKKALIETSALSKDLQAVSVGMVVNYRIKDAVKLYQNVGVDFESIIIDPFSQEDVKAVVAQYNAETLIQKRHEAKTETIEALRERLGSCDIQLVDFNFTHLDFSHEFMHAVEAKQIAEQSAKQAENLTRKVQEEALQSKTRSEAEAYALQVKRQMVTQDLIELQKVEARLKAIEKWNGCLPKFVGGNSPVLSALDIV